MTIREYLIREKIKICWKNKQKNKNYSNDDLMSMVNYDLTERSFRNHMNKYKIRSKEDSEVIPFCNMSVLSEVLVRLILYLDLAELQIEDTSFFIEYNVQDTIYRINVDSSTEKLHRYIIHIDIEDLSLSFDGPFIEDSLDSEDVLRLYHNMYVYIQYLERINSKIEKQYGFSLTESIKNWDHFCAIELKKFLLSALVGPDVKLDEMQIKINRKSDFILKTDEKLNRMKEMIAYHCKSKLENMYNVTYDTMLKYVHAANKLRYLNMKRVLKTVDNLQNDKVLKLFLTLTECSCLDDYLFVESESDLDDEVIYKLSQCSKEQIIRFLIGFKKDMEKYKEDDNEIDIYDWCRDRMKE